MEHKLSIFFTIAVAASSTMAQSAFEGAYAQIATGYQNTYIEGVRASNIDGDGAYSMIAPAQNYDKAPLMVGFGYNFSITSQFLLGLGAEYQTVSSISKTFTFIVPEGCTGQCGGAQYKTSNQYSILVALGYEIDKNRLAYFKAGYSGQSLQSTYKEGHAGDPANDTSFGLSIVSGYVFGAGYKHIITGRWYGFTEGNYYSYGRASLNNSLNNGAGKVPTTVSGYNPPSSALNFLVGLGYQF